MPAAIDLTEFPVIDSHCHSYLKSPKVLDPESFARYSSILAAPQDFLSEKSAPSKIHFDRSRVRRSQMNREQPYFNYMTKLLSKFFGCRDSIEEVSAARSRRASDFNAYVKELFDDVILRGLVLDGGYPPLPEEDVKQFPAKVARVFRIETFVKELLDRHNSFDDFCEAFEFGIRDAVGKLGFVGLKSIIAYRTGLNISRVRLEHAKSDFEEAKHRRAEMAWFGPRIKALRDFLFVRALELSIELDVPMQIHTGVGDHDILLDECNPALLYDLLKDERLRHATVVLVHGGFPDSQNAAFMASVLPNVFLDFSLTIPFLNPVSHDRLLEILQIAPASKIMYGSDGFGLPEIFWLSVKVGKRRLEKCFDSLLTENAFDAGQIEQMAERILFDNANELFRLGLERS